MCTMAIATTSSSKIQVQSSMHAKQFMLHLNENLRNDSPFSSRGFAEFQQQTDLQTSSSSPLVSEDNLQQAHRTATGQELEDTIFPESTLHLLNSVSAGGTEISHIMQGRVGSYASNAQHLPIHHDFMERRSAGEFGSLAFNELSDFWGDIRLYSHETATAAMFPPQKLEWNEASTCRTTGDPVTPTASVEYEMPPGERRCSSSSSPWAETSPEENDLECPLLQLAEHSKPSPVVTCSAGVHLDPTLIYQHVPRLSKSENVALPLSSNCQPEIPERPLSPSLQPLSSRRTRFHPQPLERSGIRDAAVGEQFTDTVVDSIVSGTRQHNFFQQVPSLSMSRSPGIDRRRQADQCGTDRGKAHHVTSENLSPLKLKQKSSEQAVGRPAPRKYLRRRAVNGIGMEVISLATPLDHVQRERQRRDLMTSKIAVLEILLPKSSKRDRVSVVYDAIHLVKRLERDVMVLQRRLHDLKERRRSRVSARYRNTIPKSINCDVGTRGPYFSNGNVIKGVGKYMKPVVIRTHPTWGKSENSRPTQRSSIISSSQCLEEGNILDRGDVMVEFHVHLDDTVTIQEEKLVKCRCRMDYLRVMMDVVDEFRLEVISCNIMKLCGYFTCILGLKTRRRKETTTAAQFAVRLQSVVDVDIMVSEDVTISLSGENLPKPRNVN